MKYNLSHASSLVIGSSLALVTQALSKLGIDLSTHSAIQKRYPLQAAPLIQGTTFQATNPVMPSRSETFEAGGAFQVPPLDSFNLDDFEISTEILDAFSSLEPIDATVGALRDLDYID